MRMLTDRYALEQLTTTSRTQYAVENLRQATPHIEKLKAVALGFLHPVEDRFSVRPTAFDLAAIVTYKNRHLSRLVYSSSLTDIIYKVFRRTPPGVAEEQPALADLLVD